ncbi:DNA repair protein [Mannheimia indoligenes]|uniref:DNA repair protein n=1 Tax=Mannheimia indoligenes TaxID=3103145 RepID=UPI002FE51B3C
MSSAVISQFDWVKELEQTVVKSLTATFGLDFLLLEDKKGGDVDTIHKAREYQKQVKANVKDSSKSIDINVSDELASKLDQSGRNVDPYKKGKTDENGNVIYNKKGKIEKEDEYHQKSDLYKERKKKDKELREKGELIDEYRGEVISAKEEQYNKDNPEPRHKRDELDHKVAASEIHDDLGRILSGLDGVKLANSEGNLASINGYINGIKDAHEVDKFINEIIPNTIEKNDQDIKKLESKLANWDLSEQEKSQIKSEIEVLKEKNELLNQVDGEKVKKSIEKARKEYNQKINWSYYTSSKFFSATAKAANKKGLQMGTRQALGLVLGEVWFELREQVPVIYQQHKVGFDLEKFWVDIQNTLKNIFLRVKARFKDLLITFKDSYIGGVLASINETILNAFFITQKMIGKMIREMWNSLVGVIKLIFFNPNNLVLGDLLKEAMKLLALSVSTLVGTTLNNYLNGLLVFPYGDLISAFISALVTGVLNLGFTYFLEHSPIMQKVWDYLNQFKSKYAKMVDHMKEINLGLDRYLIELAKVELNFNVEELARFTNELCAANSELERSIVLQQEVVRKDIELPFEAGNLDSGRKWLLKLQDNHHNKS